MNKPKQSHKIVNNYVMFQPIYSDTLFTVSHPNGTSATKGYIWEVKIPNSKITRKKPAIYLVYISHAYRLLNP